MQALYHFKISYLAPTLTSKGRKIYCLPICFHGTTLLTMYTAARTVIITVSLVIISYTHLILRIDLCTWISFLPDTNLRSDVAMSSNASFSESNKRPRTDLRDHRLIRDVGGCEERENFVDWFEWSLSWTDNRLPMTLPPHVNLLIKG